MSSPARKIPRITQQTKNEEHAQSSTYMSKVPDGDPCLNGLSLQDKAKLRAGYAAVDEHVSNDMVLGVGSGSTVVFMVERLAQRVKAENLNIICIPSSFQAIQLITKGGLVLGDLARHPKLDLVIDGADEIDLSLNCIKGGGGCHAQEKILAANSKKFVVVADYTKTSDCLGTRWTKGVPVEVIPLAYKPVSGTLEAMGATVALRMARSKAGPVVTDNGNFILDAHFGALLGEINPTKIEERIKMLAGVVEVGLFVGMAEVAYVGQADGSVVVSKLASKL